MSEPANPPPEEVAGRDAPGTPAVSRRPAVPEEPAAPAVPEEPAAPAVPEEPVEPEPPLSLTPPNARPTPPPLEANVVRIVVIGTTLWFAGFLVLLPFRGRLADGGHESWLWTCLAGGLLGLLGLVLARRARSATRR